LLARSSIVLRFPARLGNPKAAAMGGYEEGQMGAGPPWTCKNIVVENKLGIIHIVLKYRKQWANRDSSYKCTLQL